MTPTTFLVFSCPHCPLEDKQAVKWLLQRIREEQPDVIICLGDLVEADSASRWPSEYTFSLKDEFNAANNLLKDIREASPKSKLVLLKGNHDANLTEINRIDKKLRGLCELDTKNVPELRHWEMPCEYIYSRRGVYRIGAVTFGHGYECGNNCDSVHSISLGVPYGLYIGGHTHRPTEGGPVPVRMGQVMLPYWYLNTGTMREMNCHYMERKRKWLWGQGLVTGWAEPIKSPRLSKTWGAKCEVFRMFNEYDQ